MQREFEIPFFRFDGLVMRYEPPDSRNRWDSPLFTVLKDDELNVVAIEESLFQRKPPPPNLSTQNVRYFSDLNTFIHFIIWFNYQN